MALLTLNGVPGSSVCYWDISDLQSVFSTAHYYKVGIASVEMEYGSSWEDIEAYVIDYTVAPSQNLKTSANGSITLDEQIVYGFAQVSADGLCYPAGGPEDWPGMWPELDVTLTLAPTSKSIEALVQGLSYAHGHTRRFLWYLDGVLKIEQAVAPPITQHSYVISPVYFASTHKVKVEIYNETKTVMFFFDEKTTSTLYPTITPWSWSVSNGEATDAQTAASFSALTSEGLVESFHWKVWNDFVNKVEEARVEIGKAWISTYAEKSQALAEGIYSDLTVARYNSVVENIDYPFWNWHRLPGSVGYLGRLLMRGTATQGDNADTVYYQYLLELARKLNLMIGIYNNTGQLTSIASDLNIPLVVLANLISLSPGALQSANTIFMIADTLISQLPLQAFISTTNAILTSASLLISRPLTPINAQALAILTSFAHNTSRPSSVLPGVNLSVSLSIAAYLIYAHVTFLSASVGISLSLEALMDMNNQKSVLQAELENNLLTMAEVLYRLPAGLTSTLQSLLTASIAVDAGIGNNLQSSYQMTLTITALLEMEGISTWENPVQTDDDVYITQVYNASMLGSNISLE